MPSPLGHALCGVIAGTVAHALMRTPAPSAPTPVSDALAWLGGTTWGRWPVAAWRALPADVRLFAWLGMAADLDFLIGRHSRETHSLGATLAVGLGLWLATRRPRLAVAGALAYASHLLLDWLGHDTVAPIGIMALWPLTGDFYQSSLFVFEAVSRRVGAWSAWVHNADAVVREITILGPLLGMGLALWPGWKKLRAGAGP